MGVSTEFYTVSTVSLKRLFNQTKLKQNFKYIFESNNSTGLKESQKMDAMKFQHHIKQNTEEFTNFSASMKEWLRDIKTEDAKLAESKPQSKVYPRYIIPMHLTFFKCTLRIMSNAYYV